jgi:hypothetical protein
MSARSRGRVSVALLALAVGFGCVEVGEAGRGQQTLVAVLALLALGAVLFLVVSGLAALVAERPHRRRLLKVLVAVGAGGMCGILWVLLITTVLHEAARPALTKLVVVGVVVAASVAVLLGRAGHLREIAGRSLMTAGFHSLALPIAALVSFLVGGAQLGAGGSTGPELRAMILGVKLAGSIETVGLSVAGLLVGVLLVFLGDRLLRQAGRTGGADRAGTRFMRIDFRTRRR